MRSSDSRRTPTVGGFEGGSNVNIGIHKEVSDNKLLSISRRKSPSGIERKLRIALVGPVGRPIPTPGYGPVELVVDGLARGLQRAGHEVVLFASEDSTCPVPTHRGLGRSDPSLVNSRAGELAYVMNAYRHLSGFDLVHDHTLIGPAYSQTVPDLNVVTTNHGPWDDELTPVFRQLQRHVPITCISKAQQISAPVRTAGFVHHGIDASTIPTGEGSGGYMLFIGRMSEHKGPHIAAQMAHEMGFRLVLAGRVTSDEEQEFFDAKLKPLIHGPVEFAGELCGDEKFEVMGAATAILNPLQWEEPFGLVMIEALATGTPVIAFRRGSVPEIVQDGVTGFVCDSEAEMKVAIQNVASISRRACRDLVETAFTQDRMTADYLRIFSRLVAAKQQRSRKHVIDLTNGAGAAAKVPKSASSSVVALDGA